ncbi:MAG: hypothetical protein AAF961_18910, partial [Planctomycetota bacterium]
MDRRTYTFVVASAAFLFFYLSLRAIVAPPPQQNGDQPEGEQAAEVAEVDGNENGEEPISTSE